MTYQFHVPVRPYFRIHPDFKLPTVSRERAVAASWNVPSLCARYKWPSGAAGGGVIGIVELGGGWIQSDMTAFFASIGQPVPSITDVSVDGTKNTPTAGNNSPDYEVALDIQAAAAAYYVATGKVATVRVYWAQDIAPAIRAATADGCNVFSISWGADEATWGATAAADLEAAAAAATVAGMAVFAASGDNDSSDGGTNAANVDLPAGCPHVVGCGGTTLTQSTEVVWNNNPGQATGEGTGGGYSTLFPAQSWQIGIPPAPAGLGRMVPDVASDADPNTGIAIYCHGASLVIGGTSAAAPVWAGLVAACGRKLAPIAPSLYLNAQAFTPILTGDNGYYSADNHAPNPCCGMGSPLGATIAALLGSSTSPPVTTTPPPGTTPVQPVTTAPPATTRPPVTTQPPKPTTTHPPRPTTTPAPDHHHHHHPPHRHHGG